MAAPAALSLLDRVIDRVDTGILIVDPEMRIQLWNQFMVTHSQRSAEEVLGKNLFDCFPELPQRWFERKLNGVLILKNQAFTSWQQRPFLFRFSHNRQVTGGVEHMYQDCTLTPIFDDAGEVAYVCISIKDVTEVGIYETRLKQALAQLEVASHTDGLTQLFNRSHWEERFRQEVARVQRYGGKVTLLMFDLDHFKKINDTWGHQAGDEVLRCVSSRLRRALRNVDVAGRYGGEEFCVFLPSTELAGGEYVAERIRKTMARTPVEHEGRSISISVSLGITEFRDPGQSHEQLIKEADAALYFAKENGRNRFACFQQLPR
ncbi:diguanylate cyclase [Motiliproteus sp. SC1-56]|uniref:sensor domain-containing diguanylate cyclase n=1 Tax=Motiliproteus sp. SC1-56 TaxID=2799565 RepID=UPI001A8F9234|nr:diguanylate cyclase [Motiliproteus sp. SC1-56]